MEVPSLHELLPEEAQAEVKFCPEDKGLENGTYPKFYTMPFAGILQLVHMLPPSVRGKVMVDFEGDEHMTEASISNWDESYDGFIEWAVPTINDESEEAQMAMVNGMMKACYMYGIFSKGSYIPYNPREQVKRFFAAPIERKLKDYTKSQKFKDMADKIFLLLIEICSINTSNKASHFDKYEDKDAPKVWRLVTCFGDTNLDSFHDQIIAPAMGWRRHYHAYKFIVPTSGATFGPTRSDAIDMMHMATHGSFFLDTEEFDVRHVLRKEGNRLFYMYDFGDWWKHNITLVGVYDKGETFDIEKLSKYEHVYSSLKKDKQKITLLTGPKLIGGEINCPPEDSSDCDSMGDYGSILAKGPKYQVKGGCNWEEHGITKAYKFDLKAHQKRFEYAVTRKKNKQDGTMKCVFPGPGASSQPSGDSSVSLAMKGFNSSIKTKGRKLMTDGFQSEVVMMKNRTKNKCSFCGKMKGSNTGIKLFTCSRCKSVQYCGKSCQTVHWKAGHKTSCQPQSDEK